MLINGTSGDDSRTGTNSQDQFVMVQGGDDTCHGLGGDDTFTFGTAFTRDDHVYGQLGFDTLQIGQPAMSSAEIDFRRHTMLGVEQITLTGQTAYTLVLDSHTIARNEHLFVDNTDGFSIHLDDSAETNGAIVFYGSTKSDFVTSGGGDDVLNGGESSDFLSTYAGKDALFGGVGLDFLTFFGDEAFDHKDHVNGGDDGDLVYLRGNYAELTLTPDSFTSIETLRLDNNFDINVVVHKGIGPLTNQFFNVFPGLDAGSKAFSFDAHDAGQMRGADAFHVVGGVGDDTIVGSPGIDLLWGELGADVLTGGRGPDIFGWTEVNESHYSQTGDAYDVIFDFDASVDTLEVNFLSPGVVGVDDAVKSGSADFGTLGPDIEGIVGEDQLGAGHALLFRADEGTAAGQWFLIVDGNGQAGYQASGDLLVELIDPSHPGELGPGNFAIGS